MSFFCHASMCQLDRDENLQHSTGETSHGGGRFHWLGHIRFPSSGCIETLWTLIFHMYMVFQWRHSFKLANFWQKGKQEEDGNRHLFLPQGEFHTIPDVFSIRTSITTETPWRCHHDNVTLNRHATTTTKMSVSHQMSSYASYVSCSSISITV